MKKIFTFIKRINCLGWVFIVIAIFLVVGFFIIDFDNNNFLENFFFAVLGSYIVSFLIEIGNYVTIRNKRKFSFKLLEKDLKKICDYICKISNIFNTLFKIENEHVLFSYYDNKIFYKHETKNGQKTVYMYTFIDIMSLCTFKDKLNKMIVNIKDSEYYCNLNDELKLIIDGLYREKFSMIKSLYEAISCKLETSIVGINDEIEYLNINSYELSKSLKYKCFYLDLNNEYLGDDEMEKYQKILEDYKNILKDNNITYSESVNGTILGSDGNIYRIV